MKYKLKLNKKNFPVNISIPIAWGEMDAFGHVNNIIYFRYFESVRMEYFERIGIMDYMEKHGIGPILAETDARFLKAVKYPDEITVSSRIFDIKDFSFIMEYSITDKKFDVVATGSGRIVMFDYNSNKKAKLPDKIKEAIEKMEG